MLLQTHDADARQLDASIQHLDGSAASAQSVLAGLALGKFHPQPLAFPLFADVTVVNRSLEIAQRILKRTLADRIAACLIRSSPQLYAQRTAPTCWRMALLCLLFGSSSLLYAFFMLRCLLDTRTNALYPLLVAALSPA
jgi:hypothetical protein